MYTEITTYLDARIAEINNSISGTANDWLKVSLLGEKSENLKKNSYQLLLESIEDVNLEAKAFSVNAKVSVSFIIPNGDLTKYQSIVDNYVYPLIKAIRSTPHYKYSSAWVLNVEKIAVDDLDNIVNGELDCVLTLELQVINP